MNFLRNKKQYLFLFIFLLISFFVGGDSLLAQYTPLAPLPGVEEGVAVSLGDYLQRMFNLLIGVAIVLSILMIVIGGIQYMISDAVTTKEEATKRIWAAVIGLVLISASVLILQTINPDLLEFNLGGLRTELPMTNTSTHQTIVAEKEVEPLGNFCFTFFKGTGQPQGTSCYLRASECQEEERNLEEHGERIIQPCVRVATNEELRNLRYCYTWVPEASFLRSLSSLGNIELVCAAGEGAFGNGFETLELCRQDQERTRRENKGATINACEDISVFQQPQN